MKSAGKKIGLALGGGGARGFSHIGVINVLEQESIDIDLIVGTSAGALIGGAYASGQSLKEIQTKIDAYIRSPEFDASVLKSIGISFSPTKKSSFQRAQAFLMNRYYFIRAFFKPSILPSEDFKSLINHLLPDIDIRDTRIPFRAIATDLIAGKKVVISKGSLREAVLASCSVPGAVEPVRQKGKLLADGGITSLVPVHAAREAGADVVIAVMVDRDLPQSVSMETASEIIYRASEITSNKLEEAELESADIIIRPQVGDLHWTDFSRSAELIKSGENACRESLEKINASIGKISAPLPLRQRITGFFWRFFTGEKKR